MKHKLLNFNFFYTLAAIFFSFYKTDLHQVIDDLFYDVAIMFKQETASTSRHIIIDLDQKPTNDTEVFDRLIQVANQLSEADPEKIVITLYPHVFKKDDPRILQLFQKHLDDNRFYYGLYGHHSSFPTQYRLNFPFALAAHQIWGMETFKKRSPSVLRMFDFQMYLGKTSVEHLVKKVSEVKLDRPVNLQKERLGLIHPKNFQVIGWNELDIHHQQNIFQKKVVWISTSEYRIRPIFADEDHVNTSWQKEGGPLENGFPFVYALAGATINLEQNKILNAISIYSQIFLTLFFSLYCFYVWYTPHSLTLSTILYFLGWITFVFCTSLSVSFLNYWIPIAPNFLCS